MTARARAVEESMRAAASARRTEETVQPARATLRRIVRRLGRLIPRG